MTPWSWPSSPRAAGPGLGATGCRLLPQAGRSRGADGRGVGILICSAAAGVEGIKADVGPQGGADPRGVHGDAAVIAGVAVEAGRLRGLVSRLDVRCGGGQRS